MVLFAGVCACSADLVSSRTRSTFFVVSKQFDPRGVCIFVVSEDLRVHRVIRDLTIEDFYTRIFGILSMTWDDWVSDRTVNAWVRAFNQFGAGIDNVFDLTVVEPVESSLGLDIMATMIAYGFDVFDDSSLYATVVTTPQFVSVVTVGPCALVVGDTSVVVVGIEGVIEAVKKTEVANVTRAIVILRKLIVGLRVARAKRWS